ncbi:MAG: cytochrome c-type biogenesis protein [Novosphingobium sp.]|uniref:cytochrome c-type biogenesis protein n=1 Tax=Novosphingobium sp. TaxID=1874826 RepID=UPI0032B8CAD3
MISRTTFAGLLLVLAIPAQAQTQDYAEISLADPAQETQALALMDSIRCVVCQGQPISGSNAGLAGDMRRIIRERIAAGDTPETVRAMLISKYGDWVSFKPVIRSATAPLWLVPLLALLGGAWLVSRRLKIRKV